ncbi:MAG: FAD-binding oxidoreductase [Tannerella sp.]|nr:FAD-binding oxidoreductase [Tannerella sp.]
MKRQIYTFFIRELLSFLSPEQVLDQEIYRLAWGMDAGFYRLIPRVVVFPKTEEEVCEILRQAAKYNLPVTFRAAGTSLSGQAITDAVLLVAGQHWERYRIAGDGKTIAMQPGIVGERVNQWLKPYGRKISPDPASLKSARIGGIVINNASGMSCGTHANADKMIVSARIVLTDGTVLDTGDPDSRNAFAGQKPEFLRQIERLRDCVRENRTLVERIKRKYSIKNVMGLNLMPFVSYDDPFDIITHLMVGSEGTLGFLSEATLRTEALCPFKASAMVYFRELREACFAVNAFKSLLDTDGRRLVASAELLDTKALACVGDTTGEGLTAILLETQSQTESQLHASIERISRALEGFRTFSPVSFTSDEEACARMWQIRSGVFPAVGGSRPVGTTALIEDVAFHTDDLPDAITALQQLLVAHGYLDACIYGHALEGNVHFVLNQSFATDAEVQRYEKLMREVVDLVVHKYDGSLKAEHGTGRNMAPFVRIEWGRDAYEVMRRVKTLFDPENRLNPGVIFNDDPLCHIKRLKPLPLVHPVVDKCIECGFCEVNCLTCGFTLSSRQRIVVQREITRLEQAMRIDKLNPARELEQSGNTEQSGGAEQAGDAKRALENKKRLQKLRKQYRYAGEQTCAGDGLCALSCPMGINVGKLTHVLRSELHPKGSFGYRIGAYAARHLSFVKSMLRVILRLAGTARRVFGVRLTSAIARGMHKGMKMPLWTPAMPEAISQPSAAKLLLSSTGGMQAVESTQNNPLTVVYFPSCINQTMGLSHSSTPSAPSHFSTERVPLVEKTIALLRKAGYRVVFPKGMANLCCGTIWESKGMDALADRKTAELEEALWEASGEGAYPVLCDQSPCLYRMRDKMTKIKLYEPVAFVYTFLRDKLIFHPQKEPVAIHITCSMRKMGLADMFIELAGLCAEQVVAPEEVGCCGFAGDKGFTHPEVNDYALRKLRSRIEAAHIHRGYCNSRTCEIGLATHSGIDYQSIVYLVDACTTPK